MTQFLVDISEIKDRYMASTIDKLASSVMPSTGPSSINRLQYWRAALARVRGGTGRGTLAIIGDSTTSGAGAGVSGTLNEDAAWPLAWPRAMANILTNEYGISVNDNNLWGDQAVTTYTTYDTRLTLGTGWSYAGANTLAGRTLQYVTGSASTVAFVPVAAFDTIKIYYLRQSGNGTFTTNVDGGASLGTTNTNGATSVQVASFTVAKNTHTLNIVAGNDNPLFIFGIKVYDSTTPQIDLIRSGWVGAKTSSYVQSGFVYSPLTLLQTNVVPDLTIVMLTINDSENSTSLDTYRSQMQTIITAALATGDCILCSGAPSNSTIATNGTLQCYVNVLYSLALTNNIPMIDLKQRWGSYSAINSIFAYADTQHPGPLAYQDMGRMVAQTIAFP